MTNTTSNKPESESSKPFHTLFNISEAFKSIQCDKPLFNNVEPLSTSIFYEMQSKPTIEEQYSNIQEELSKITRIYHQERKEHVEIVQEKDKQILKLDNEKAQLQKKYARAKVNAKSYKDELKREGQLSKALIDLEDMREENRQLKDELDWKETNK